MPESAATYSDGSARLEAAGREQARALGADDRPDAFSSGIVKGSAERTGEALSRQDSPSGRGRAGFAEPSPAGAGRPKAKSRFVAQAKGNLKRAIANAAVSEADDSEELSGVGRASGTVRGARSVIARHSASKKASAASKAKGPLKGAAKRAKAGAFGQGAAARARMVKGGPAATAAELQRFHDTLFAAYADEIGGNAVFRMKEWWFYAKCAFADPATVHKIVRKTKKVDEYRAAVERVFREQPLAPIARFHG